MSDRKANTVLPFRPLAGIPLLEARIGDRTGYMVFDTGAMRTALNGKYFPELTGESLEIARFDGQLAAAGARDTRVTCLELPGLILRDLPVMVMDLDYVEAGLRTLEPDLQILGTLGIDVLRRFRVLLDYGAGQITLDPEPLPAGEAVPLHMEALPVIEPELGGARWRLVLDTGANTCLLDAALEPELAAGPDPETPGLTLLPPLTLGARQFDGVSALFTDISHIRAAVPAEGVIGYQVLGGQPELLDFEAGTLTFLS